MVHDGKIKDIKCVYDYIPTNSTEFHIMMGCAIIGGMKKEQFDIVYNRLREKYRGIVAVYGG